MLDLALDALNALMSLEVSSKQLSDVLHPLL